MLQINPSKLSCSFTNSFYKQLQVSVMPSRKAAPWNYFSKLNLTCLKSCIMSCRYLEIGIESGLPVSLNGKTLSPATLLTELNEIGGRHGVGRIDMVENRLVGMKSRGVYETPGGTILFAAARELEFLTLDRETIQVKDSLALKYAELVYAGRWFDPLRESMDAFMQKITETTTGSVTLKLYKGSVTVTGRKSPFSLYRQDISSFEGSDVYDQADAAGFIRLYGLPMRVRAMLEQGI